jgi:hypothetical protein
MRTLLPCLLLATPCAAQYNTTNLKVDAAAPDKPLVLDHLGIYPVIANEAFLRAFAQLERSTPMKRALGEGQLTLTEKSGGAEVNKLMATNAGKDTIYLMQGEVVSGGKQDRVLAQDMLLAPGQTIDVAAFCVEQGRWDAGGEKRAFATTTGVSAKEVRKAAAKDKDQQAVWRNVEVYLEENAVKAPTGTLNALQHDSTFNRSVARYRAHFADAFAGRTDVVGVVAVSGGQVIGCDLFATPALFQGAFEGLLTAYITEAITRGGPVKLGPAEASTFLQRLLADEDGLEQRLKDRGTVFRSKGRTLRVSYF